MTGNNYKNIFLAILGKITPKVYNLQLAYFISRSKNKAYIPLNMQGFLHVFKDAQHIKQTIFIELRNHRRIWVTPVVEESYETMKSLVTPVAEESCESMKDWVTPVVEESCETMEDLGYSCGGREL